MAQQPFADLAPGVYDVSEDAHCTAMTSAARRAATAATPDSVTVKPGRGRDLPLPEYPAGQPHRGEAAVGGDGSFAFTSQALGSFNLTTVRGAAQPALRRPAARDYDLSETVPGRLGADRRDLRQRQRPGQHQPGPGRGRDLHLRQHEAGAT